MDDPPSTCKPGADTERRTQANIVVSGGWDNYLLCAAALCRMDSGLRGSSGRHHPPDHIGLNKKPSTIAGTNTDLDTVRLHDGDPESSLVDLPRDQYYT
ncbi:unnamed protein product [Dibothriocephalus latus]|uniref:Uncharacterized protein n=1 Tax=Dibothriocephalus latus TaxID=60516 RepID=A0A3P6PC98_DIBLA|nr:unnamed protein product [Dibothriocephalus latus]